jgi:hypothetical protein
MKEIVEYMILRVTMKHNNISLEHYSFKVMSKRTLGRCRWRDIWNEDGDYMMIGIWTKQENMKN